MYPEQWEWGKIQQLTGQVIDQAWAILPRFSGLIAFDTFVANMDRVNDNNAIFATNPRDKTKDTFIFLDYANSLNMGDRWATGKWISVDEPPAYPRMRENIDLPRLKETLAKIEGLNDTKLRDVVDRIPDDYMSAAHRTAVLEGLLGRRSLVRQMISKHYPI